jgi:hypothetical protein
MTGSRHGIELKSYAVHEVEHRKLPHIPSLPVCCYVFSFDAATASRFVQCAVAADVLSYTIYATNYDRAACGNMTRSLRSWIDM